jgi:hypothetical protein
MVPGEGSSTGNVTGGRKFARHYFMCSHRHKVIAGGAIAAVRDASINRV